MREHGDVSSSSSGSQSSSSSSSSQEEQEKNTQPFTLAAYPAYSFHPALSTSQANLTLAPLLYESLFTVDSTFTATPQLCQSYTVSEDGLTWTFQLRAGVTFSDGTPLTGEIVAQALQTAKDPASRYAKRLANVSGVSGSGEQVTITLTTPNGRCPRCWIFLSPWTAPTAHWGQDPMFCRSRGESCTSMPGRTGGRERTA